MVNKRTSDSDKQKSKKQKSDTEASDYQNVDNSNKIEMETTPKRSTRTRSKNNSEDINVNNTINNLQNNNSEMTMKKTVPIGSSVGTVTSYKTNETNSITNSPVVTRGRAAKKAKKTDSEVSSPALSERSRRSSKSESDAKSTRGRSKSRRSRGKKVSQSEQHVIEDNDTVDNTTVKSKKTTEQETINEAPPVVVEIDGKDSSPLKTQLANSMSSETSLQEVDHSTILSSEQSISSITEIKDEVDESEISLQQVTSQTSSSTTEKVKPIPTDLKNFTIEIKSNIKQSNESDPKTDTIHNNSTTKTTPPASNHYNSRSHSKRKKKLTSKKHELSSRSVYIPAGLVNPFREKSHHQKVDESIKEDMEIIRECNRSKSDSPSKLETEKLDNSSKKNSQGTRRSLRRNYSNQGQNTNANGGVGSPKTRYSPEQLTKLNSYNQGVLPFHALDDVSKTEVNDDFCSICHQSTGCFLCCDSCPKSFHFDCFNPPLDKSSIPEGIWECKECRAKKNPELNKENANEKNYWKVLMKNLDKHNPKSFELPDWLINEYENIIKNPVTGDYLDVSQWKSVRISRNGIVSHPSQSETYLKTIPICYKCGEGISKDHLVQCDYCDLSWHLDCLDPPLSSNPNTNIILIGNANSNGIITKQNNNSNGHDNGSDHSHSKENIVIENHRIYGMKRKWMCPCHADWEMPKKRHKKTVIEVDIENLNEADFEKIAEFEAGKIDSDNESSINIPNNSQDISKDHSTTINNANENLSNINIKKEEDINNIEDSKKETSEEPIVLHYSDNTREIAKVINPSYVELDNDNLNPDAIQNEFINHVQNLRSTLRSYHSKVMELPDHLIAYHSNISSLYSDDNDDKNLIPNIPEQDIEDWLSMVTSLQQDIAKELNYRKSLKKYWENIRIEKLPDPPYDVCTYNKQLREKKHLDKLEVLCKAALDAPYNQYVTSKNVTQIIDTKILFNNDEKIKEIIMNDTDELTLEQDKQDNIESNESNEKSSSSGIISKDDPLFKQFLNWRKLCKTILNPSSSIM